ncbi:MAG: hypothetical protein P1U63_11965 [Coxiellaceae bacterium]|nr:hypothetical protein [Coxiellaceae bacterium]
MRASNSVSISKEVSFELNKVHRRSQQPENGPSLFVARNKVTGEKSLYRAPIARAILINGVLHHKRPATYSLKKWHEMRFASGSAGAVKQLTKLSPPFSDTFTTAQAAHAGITPAATSLPTAIALKCYHERSEAQSWGATKATYVFNSQGKFAYTFERNDKLYFANEWIDGEDLAIALLKPSTKKLTGTELLHLFKGYINRIVYAHKAINRPIGDLKPGNIIAIQHNKKIHALMPVDIDSDNPSTYTPAFSSPVDLEAIKLKKYECSFASDFRSIAIIFAICCKTLTGDYLDYKACEDGTYHCETVTKTGAGAADKDICRTAINFVFETLQEGKNPFAKPHNILTEAQLHHDILHALHHTNAQLKSRPTPLHPCSPISSSDTRTRRVLLNSHQSLEQLKIWMQTKLSDPSTKTKQRHHILNITTHALTLIKRQITAVAPSLISHELSFYNDTKRNTDIITLLNLTDLPSELDRLLLEMQTSCTPIKVGCCIS